MDKKIVLILAFILLPLICFASDYPSVLEAKIFKLVNIERVKNGLKPLKASSELSSIALEHSADMAQRGYVSHITPEGLSPSDRAKKSGFNIIIKRKNSERIGVGENIAVHQAQIQENGVISYYLEPAGELAPKIVQGWMNSPGHRKNILNSDYTRVGTGVAVSKDKKILATQVFF
jgi:uncharacterized protein YkwD